MFAPLIPGLNDHEMEAVLAAARDAGATQAGYVMLRLPIEVKDLFREWLDAAVPARAAKVMSLVRSMRGGKDYDANWGTRMRGEGPIADIMRDRFRMACHKLGLNSPGQTASLDTTQFKIPDLPPATGQQLKLSCD